MSKFILIDRKFRKHVFKYIAQCFLASLTILAVLIFLDILTETAIITALGASAFIVFTMPTQYSSDPRRLIGGYVVGLSVGFIFYFVSQSQINSILAVSETTTYVIFGAIAVGFSIFIMSVTNTEHAPAAGIALGLVINRWEYLTIVYVVLAILWLSSVRFILREYLMDFISPHVNHSSENKR